MKPFTACLFVALLSGGLASPAGVSKWATFKAKHAKQHAVHEESNRMKAFLEKDAEIEAHNVRYAAGQESYSRQHSQYSDLTIEEFRKSALGFVPAVNASEIPHAELPAMPSRPERFDWREQGVMTPVRNQLYCGSCYAFAGAGALEGFINWKQRVSFDLSEQDCVDCSYKKFMGGSQNSGCQGGWPSAVYEHYIKRGAVLERDYPYASGQSQTHYQCKVNAKVTQPLGNLRFTNVRTRSEDEMADILVAKGPVVIALAADNQWKPFFDDLGDGVFDKDNAVGLQPNHAVVLVGFGVQAGKPYWVIKNSWGSDWAVGGYGKIRRGRNMCGLNTFGVWYAEQ